MVFQRGGIEKIPPIDSDIRPADQWPWLIQILDQAEPGSSDDTEDGETTEDAPPDETAETRFTIGGLVKKVVVSDETIRKAAEAAGFTKRSRGDRTAWIGPREVTLIANQRFPTPDSRPPRGPKEQKEYEEWQKLIQEIGADPIGTKPKAKRRPDSD